MSTGDKKGGPQKPFLGEAELSSELDAWDEMFDNLHAGPEAGLGEAPPAPAPMEWPTPQEPAPAEQHARPRVPEAAVTDPAASRTLDDLSPGFDARGDTELDDQLTLDGAIPNPIEAPRPSHARLQEWNPSADETDFSDVGAQAEPQALGQPLGGDVPQWVDDSDAGHTAIMPPDPEAVRGPVVPDGASWDHDDDVYTSASRPDVKAAHDDRSLPDDPIAPPPSRAPVAPHVTKRTGPAIIRRTPVSVPVVKPPQMMPPRGYPAQDSAVDLAESTRVTDVGEMEAKVEATRRADARSKAPTAPPPMSFTPAAYADPAPEIDDDYEI